VIVVTGASGVIGRAVMTHLRSKEIEAIGVNREAFDLASDHSLAVFIGQRPEAIIHLAAAVPHSTYYPDNQASADKTQAVDKTVYDAANEWGCRVVYASTCSLYNKQEATVKFEDAPIAIRGNSPYLQAKQMGEKMFATLDSNCILRVPAPIGLGLPETVVAKRFFDQGLAGQVIRVWGTGKREQNYVDVRDIADIFLRAACLPSLGIFNISADTPTTMLELAELITKVIPGASFEMAKVADPLEPEYARYSHDRARELLGWVPKLSLENSILSMFEIYNESR